MAVFNLNLLLFASLRQSEPHSDSQPGSCEIKKWETNELESHYTTKSDHIFDGSVRVELDRGKKTKTKHRIEEVTEKERRARVLFIKGGKS